MECLGTRSERRLHGDRSGVRLLSEESEVGCRPTVDQDDGVGGARYDEYASWYDDRLQGERHPTHCVVCRAILDLDDGRSGVLLDIGCGGAAHRRARTGRSEWFSASTSHSSRFASRGSVSTPWP